MSLQLEFTGGELTPTLWAKSNAPVYAKGLKTCKNFIVMPTGGVTNRPGTVFVGKTKLPDQPVRLVPFEFSTEDTLVLEFGNGYIRFIKHDPVTHKSGYVETSLGSGVPYEVSTPYATHLLADLQFQQIGDVVTIVHPLKDPIELSRLLRTNNSWDLSVIPWQGNLLPAPTNLQINNQGGGQAGHWFYAVTAVDDQGRESLAATRSTGGVIHWEANDHVDLTWDSVAGADYYRIYLARYGVYGVIGEAKAPLTDFTDINIIPDYTQGGLPQPPDVHPQNAGHGPSTLSVHNLRMMYGGTTKAPNHVFGTRPGNYHDLGTNLPIAPDSAIDWYLASNQLDDIEHLFSWRKQLLIFTAGGLWIAEGDNEVMSATSFQLSPNLGVECSDVRPLIIGDNIVFMGRHKDIVYDMQYSFDADGYHETDRSIHASHLLEFQKIVQWAYQRRPYSIIWAITDKGELLGLTYLPSATEGQGIWAWHRHETKGKFESVTVIKEHDEDAVYVSVVRTINGTTARYIERLHHRKIKDNNVTDGIFSDCTISTGISPTRTTGTTIVSGLDHLEGEKVAVIADGDFIEDMVVTGGSITLPYPAEWIHVGLPYTCDLEPLNYMGEATSRGYKSAQGKRKRPVAVSLYVEDSRGFKLGADDKSLYDTPRLAMNGLYTGEYKMNLAGAWQKNAGLLIRHETPLPLTILSLSPVYEAGS